MRFQSFRAYQKLRCRSPHVDKGVLHQNPNYAPAHAAASAFLRISRTVRLIHIVYLKRYRIRPGLFDGIDDLGDAAVIDLPRGSYEDMSRNRRIAR
jgi:hypothetical protein